MTRSLLALMLSAGLASSAQATGVYVIARESDRSDPSKSSETLYRIDSETGASQAIATFPFTAFQDLAGRAGDPGGVYTLSRQANIENSVWRIDLESGTSTELYRFAMEDLGDEILSLEFTGISISSSQPSIATILGIGVIPNQTSSGFVGFVFNLELDTGKISGLQLLDSGLAYWAAYAPDGTLYGNLLSDSAFSLGTIDRGSGATNTIGGFDVLALEFDPVTGELLAVEYGELYNSFLRLSPEDGTVLERFVSDFRAAPTGVAFVVPEANTGSLVMIGLAALGLRRRGTNTRPGARPSKTEYRRGRSGVDASKRDCSPRVSLGGCSSITTASASRCLMEWLRSCRGAIASASSR